MLHRQNHQDHAASLLSLIQELIRCCQRRRFVMSTTDAGDGSLFLNQQKPPKVEYWRIRISLYVVTFPKKVDSIHQTILQTKIGSTDQRLCLLEDAYLFFTFFNEGSLRPETSPRSAEVLGFFQLSLTTQDTGLGD